MLPPYVPISWTRCENADFDLKLSVKVTIWWQHNISNAAWANAVSIVYCLRNEKLRSQNLEFFTRLWRQNHSVYMYWGNLSCNIVLLEWRRKTMTVANCWWHFAFYCWIRISNTELPHKRSLSLSHRWLPGCVFNPDKIVLELSLVLTLLAVLYISV